MAKLINNYNVKYIHIRKTCYCNFTCRYLQIHTGLVQQLFLTKEDTTNSETWKKIFKNKDCVILSYICV